MRVAAAQILSLQSLLYCQLESLSKIIILQRGGNQNKEQYVFYDKSNSLCFGTKSVSLSFSVIVS